MEKMRMESENYVYKKRNRLVYIDGRLYIAVR